MNAAQIGINLYSIKDFLQTEEQTEQALQRLVAIGYQAVELCILPGMLDIFKTKALCDRYGLQICGVHCGTVLDDPCAVNAVLDSLNCQLVSFPYPAGRDLSDPSQVEFLIHALQKAGEYLFKHGKTLTYHNHHLELIRTDGMPVLEQIYAKTDSRFIQAELDTYWIQYGGCNPADWCIRLAGRLPQIHLKDYCVGSDGQPCSCTLGHGNLNMQAIVNAADAGGCQWYIIEQEHYIADPFDELAEGFRFLRLL